MLQESRPLVASKELWIDVNFAAGESRSFRIHQRLQRLFVLSPLSGIQGYQKFMHVHATAHGSLIRFVVLPSSTTSCELFMSSWKRSYGQTWKGVFLCIDSVFLSWVVHHHFSAMELAVQRYVARGTTTPLCGNLWACGFWQKHHWGTAAEFLKAEIYGWMTFCWF